MNCNGKKDIIAGTETGHVVYFENTGTDTVPVFNGSVSISIYDSSGRVVKSCTVSGQSGIAVVSAESMAVGVYTVIASDARSTSLCRVLVTNGLGN
ncbi:MAG: hypothetical protein KAR40_14610 [Candidatus Sabulitectum sp.]|nr:hypothetical protein [Candidatus Sabulitectum sp.]